MARSQRLSFLKISSALGILIWVLLMGILLKRTALTPLAQRITWRQEGQVAMGPGESWMGIYLHDRKVGYSVTRWEKEDLDLRMMERTVMELMVMGRPQTVQVSTQCLLDPFFALKSFSFSLTAEGVDFRAEGERKGKGMTIRLWGMGERRELQIPMQEMPYLWPSLRFFLKNRNLREGDRLEVSLFDPITLTPERLTIQVERKERLALGGKDVEVRRVKQTFRGIAIHSWIGEGGEILKEESPLGFTLVKEEKEAAILRGRGTGRAGDLIALAAVPSSVKIPDPEAIRTLRVRLMGFPREGLNLDGGRQRLRGSSLEIHREDLSFRSPPLPIRDPSLSPYLEPTPFLQSEDPRLKEKARAILEGEINSLAAAKKLALWVFRNIEKRPTLSIPSALEVLQTGVGDCNEHTTLFVGLARAAGLPAKIAAGLVYVRGKFYYHAWPEVYVGQWIAIDPTLNQFPADATHLRLVEGGLERQAELVQVMGRVSLDILGFQ